MPRLAQFGGDKEKFNEWYRNYRAQNRERVREIGREHMRRVRTKQKEA
jgi:hypothetical protein